MTEKMEIRGVGKPSDDLMTISNPEGERFLVFDKAIYPHLEIGKIVELEVKRDMPKKSGDGTYNFIQSITVDGKVIGGKKRSGYAPRGRDEDRTDRRNAIITIKDIWLHDKIKDNNPLVIWMLAELLVIATGKKEAKGETTKDNKGSKTANQSQVKGEVPRQDSREATDEECPVTNAGTLFSWIMAKDPSIKAPRLWVQTEFGLSDKEVITDEKAQTLYKTIKTKMKW